VAIGLGLMVSFGVGLAIFLIEIAIPGTSVRNIFDLIVHDSSATLVLGPLFQGYEFNFQREEALFVTPLALLCGGLTLGLTAPRVLKLMQVLWAAAGMSTGLLAVSLAFAWYVGLYETDQLARSEGGMVARQTAPPEYVLNLLLWHVSWVIVCVLGAYLGQRYRTMTAPVSRTAPAVMTTPPAA